MMPTPDELILALLATEPQHGYQLLDAFRDPARLGHIWNMSTAQVYAVLKRLEQGGLVSGAEVTSSTAPTRVEYQTTPAGRAQLEAWLHDSDLSPSIRRVRVDFLSRVYAASLLGEAVTPLAQRQAAVCAAERSHIARLLDAAISDAARLALSLQLAQLDAVLNWISNAFGIAASKED